MKPTILGITVRCTDLADTVLIDLDETAPLAGVMFAGDPPGQATLTIEVRAGHGVAWCKRVFGIEPRVINAHGTAPSWMVTDRHRLPR